MKEYIVKHAQQEIYEKLENDLHSNETFCNKTALDNSPNYVGENCIFKELSDEQQRKLTTGVEKQKEVPREDKNCKNIYLAEKELKALAVARAAMRQMRSVKSAVRKVFYNYRKALRLLKVSHFY